MDKWSTAEEKRLFMQRQGIVYLERAKLSDHPSLQRPLIESPYYLDNREEFDQLSGLYGPALLKETTAPVSIRNISKDVGYGLFAEEDLEPGTFIGEYTGLIQEGVDTAPVESGKGAYETDYTWDYPDAWYEDILFEVNALTQGNELRYVNHSFEPNLVVEHTLIENRWAIFFLTENFIKVNTQLTVDYGEEYWSGGFRELVLF